MVGAAWIVAAASIAMRGAPHHRSELRGLVYSLSAGGITLMATSGSEPSPSYTTAAMVADLLWLTMGLSLVSSGRRLRHPWVDSPENRRAAERLHSSVPAGATVVALALVAVAQRRERTLDPVMMALGVLVVVLSGARGLLMNLHNRSLFSRLLTSAEELTRTSRRDPLTGLGNRLALEERLGLALRQRSPQGTSVLFIDIDNFKQVNDSLGHDAGDRLLQHVAAALGAALRGSDSVARPGSEQAITVARLGGDEFTIVAEDLQTSEDALRIAERVQRALQTPVQVGKHEIVISTSIGITVYPDDASPPDDLLRHADQAMYRAKELGRDQVQFYSAEMNDQAQRRLQLEAELRHALERNEFELVWQPKADLASGRISGVEALLRWNRDGHPVATPAVFIQVLEETGLILPVGRWVLEQATRQICAWRRAGLPWLRVAVNLSARQLRQGDLLGTVNEVLESSGLPSAQLELELTESMLMGGEHHAQLLHQLSALGVQLAIDDFGTGWSSLSYLKRFNVDTLKIDRSFVRDTPHDPEDNAITTAVIALARSLKLRVVAEGVETPAQRQFLLDNDCDEFQGWLLSRPLSAQAFESWWRQRLLVESGKVIEHSTLP
jgi:diguanylate cyclase (GGDEF)-like protein